MWIKIKPIWEINASLVDYCSEWSHKTLFHRRLFPQCQTCLNSTWDSDKSTQNHEYSTQKGPEMINFSIFYYYFLLSQRSHLSPLVSVSPTNQNMEHQPQASQTGFSLRLHSVSQQVGSNQTHESSSETARILKTADTWRTKTTK